MIQLGTHIILFSTYTICAADIHGIMYSAHE